MGDDRTGPRAGFEPLDPEPPAAAGRARRREALLGGLLVLALVGFGLWQWAGTQIALGHYQAGGQAAAQDDWPAAATAYAAAGGYQDAPARAAAAATAGIVRDTAWAAAQTPIAARDWLRALPPLETLQTVAPAYHDAGRLAVAAATQVAVAALSGTVLLRPQATPAGLYAYTGTTPHHLPATDTISAIQSRCPDGALLVDAPLPAPAGPPVPPLPDGPLRSRELLLETPGGTVPQPLTLRAGAYERFACGATAVWGLRSALVAGPAPPILAAALQAAYEARGAADAGALLPVLPDPAWAILAVAPDGRHILLADPRPLRDGGGAWPLYWAAPDGSGRRLLATLTGFPRSTQVQDDGTVLVVTDTPAAGGSPWDTRVLLVRAAGGPPILLAEGITDPLASALPVRQATFLPPGPRGGQVVIGVEDGGTLQVRLFDAVGRALATVPIPGASAQAVPAGLDVDPASGTLAVAWDDPDGYATGSAGFVLTVDAAQRAEVRRPALIPGDDLGGAWVRAGRLIYESGLTPTWPARLSLRSLPLAAAPAVAPVEIYSATNLVPEVVPAALYRLGPAFLTYLTPSGEVRARTYDGAVDRPITTLEPGALFTQPVTDP